MFASNEQIYRCLHQGYAAPPFTMPEETLPVYLCEPESAPLSVLAGEDLGGRFRFWRGASGRRYMFSVYSSEACPAYDRAVLVGAAVEADGSRRILFIDDTGAFPEPALGRARARLAKARSKIEFHVHLLAVSPAERTALIDDLAPPPEFAPWRRNWSASHSSSLS
jgi:hypothetical protein